jgi:flagellar basal-body rod modification protein FlgD
VTTPITPTPISEVLGNTATSTTTTGPNKALGQDDFLKLLVAQLRYQDPSNPTDGSQLMAQTAQFTQVEKLSQLVTDQQSMMASQRMLSAGSMVGRTVTYPGADGLPLSGPVTSATLTGSEPTLRVGHTDVPLSSVMEIK